MSYFAYTASDLRKAFKAGEERSRWEMVRDEMGSNEAPEPPDLKTWLELNG